MNGEWMDEWRDGDGWGKARPASARKGKWVALAGGRSNDESGAVPVIYSTPHLATGPGIRMALLGGHLQG